jgi:hypothetical protein
LPALPNFIYFKGLNATAVGSFGRQVSMLKNYLGVLNLWREHRDRTRAHTLCCFGLFFSSFEHAKNLLIMGPTTLKTHH